MKNKIITVNASKLNGILTAKQGKLAALTISDLKNVKGGEGDGGGNIIIPFPR